MLFAVVTLLAGAVALWSAWLMSRELQAARGWPTVPGTILERGVGTRMGRISHAPHVRYAYSVAGRDYVNDQVYLAGTIGGAAGRIRQLVDGLPDPVPVHYDPGNPARSYLLVTPWWAFWALAAAGASAVVAGCWQLLAAVTSRSGWS